MYACCQILNPNAFIQGRTIWETLFIPKTSIVKVIVVAGRSCVEHISIDFRYIKSFNPANVHVYSCNIPVRKSRIRREIVR